MLFQHTLDKVLSGEIDLTARIWKDSYRIGAPRFLVKHESLFQFHNRSLKQIWNNSATHRRRLYYIGQELSVQPGRGEKGVAKIRVAKLWVQDVRKYNEEDIRREGFSNRQQFLDVWCELHDKRAHKNKLALNASWGDKGWLTWLNARPDEYYTALCIQFELVK